MGARRDAAHPSLTTPNGRRLTVETMTIETARERARAGMALLDEKAEPNWRELICVDSLDLSTTDCCVLGQVYGRYGYGIDELDISGRGEELGFYADFRDYEPLQQAWEELLTVSA
jgi:hypothetical protein